MFMIRNIINKLCKSDEIFQKTKSFQIFFVLAETCLKRIHEAIFLYLRETFHEKWQSCTNKLCIFFICLYNFIASPGTESGGNMLHLDFMIRSNWSICFESSGFLHMLSKAIPLFKSRRVLLFFKVLWREALI